jgi:mRNA interferase RelE/StbE
MPTYEIVISKSAQKYILSCPPNMQRRIYDKIYQLPEGTNIVKLQGFENRYRIRLSGIRIIYDQYDNILKILVLKIGPRGDIYKDAKNH